MLGLEIFKKYEYVILKYVSFVLIFKVLIIDFCICMVNGSKKLKGCYNLLF